MRVVAITKIFPNRLEPLSSPFNRQQFVELGKLCELTVLAAVPYVPFAKVLGAPKRAAALSDLPSTDELFGIKTHTLRQLYIPKVGLSSQLPLYLASLLRHKAVLDRADALLGTWAYPDGCAAAVLGQRLGKPSLIKLHGSDINVVGKRWSARAYMRACFPLANAVVGVSRPLVEQARALGARRAVLVENGVEPSLFGVTTREQARGSLPLEATARVILFVGRLEAAKGIPELLDAFVGIEKEMPEAHLVLAGDGVLRGRVEAFANGRKRVHVLGPRPLSEVATWMAAADVVTLPSHREGTPNVVLEALASGRPVVATEVGGIPDLLRSEQAGFLVPVGDVDALRDKLVKSLRHAWDETAIRAHGPKSWRESARALWELLQSIRK